MSGPERIRRGIPWEVLQAAELGGRSPGDVPRAPSVRRFGTGTGTGSATRNGNNTRSGTRPLAETGSRVGPRHRYADLARGQRNGGNGTESGGTRSIIGSELLEFERPLQLRPAPLSASGSDSDRETEAPQNRAVFLTDEAEGLDAFLTEREAQLRLRPPRGRSQEETRVPLPPTLLEAISASRERMENRAYVRQHLARRASQEAARGVEHDSGDKEDRKASRGTN